MTDAEIVCVNCGVPLKLDGNIVRCGCTDPKIYIWDVLLECGHSLVVEKFVPGAPGSPKRCFDDSHEGTVGLFNIQASTLTGTEDF